MSRFPTRGSGRGYSGGHAHAPRLELGAAYDAAMQSLVFDPLGMTATTFELSGTLKNFALPHAQNLDGAIVAVPMPINAMSRPSGPDGGAISSVNDVLLFLRMELGDGRLPNGNLYIDSEALLARREQHR